ncbi:MAG TPA: PhnD/SsuA/transferrin family substrate-binding protein [Burkholderiaceae bacterium]|nr:PhnD/SsuA/transferrin family substrate-binding protein [Burkholderiaceae bacterium]
MRITIRTFAGSVVVLAGMMVMLSTARAEDFDIWLGLDTADRGSELVLTTSAASAMSRFIGTKVAITQSSNLAEAFTARALDNEAIIGPAHVTAAALQNGYRLIATTGQDTTYALVVRKDISSTEQLRGTRLYLTQPHSVRTYIGKGWLSQMDLPLKAFADVTYGRTGGAGLIAISSNLADATVVEENEAKQWIANNPGYAVVLKTTRSIPGGLGFAVRRDVNAEQRARLLQWVNSPDGLIVGVGKFVAVAASEQDKYNYVISFAATNAPLAPATGVQRVSAGATVRQ